MSQPFEEVCALNSNDVEIKRRETVYDGFFKMQKVELRHRLFAGGWGQAITRELFIRGHAVAAIMYDRVNDLVGLVEQFRIGALETEGGPWLFEAVAGMIEPGEEPEAVMRRELKEEAAMVPVDLVPICDYLSSPGGTNESLALFCALGDLRHIGGIHGLPEEGEDIRVRVFSADSVLEGIYSGRYNNAATLIGLQWLAMNREKLREVVR